MTARSDMLLAIAEPILERFGLSGWSVEFINETRKAGECDFASKTIRISLPVASVRSLDETRNTILHEVAHAIAGHAHGHDEMWRTIFVNIGGNGESTFESVRHKIVTV